MLVAEEQDRITEIYDAAARGELSGHDARWIEADSLIRAMVVGVLHKVIPKLYGSPAEQYVTQVSTIILEKFVRRRLPRRGDSIVPVMRMAIRNEIMEACEQCRSVPTTDLPEWEDNGAREDNGSRVAAAAPEIDIFGEIRERLGEFRFPEWAAIREALLAYFVLHRDYPGPSFVGQFGVDHDMAAAIYNAALFDLNGAIKKVVASAA